MSLFEVRVSFEGKSKLRRNIVLSLYVSAIQVNEAAEIIYDLVDPSANLIFGAVVDPKLSQEVHITLIATGFGGHAGETTPMATTSQQAIPQPETTQRPIVERPSKASESPIKVRIICIALHDWGGRRIARQYA